MCARIYRSRCLCTGMQVNGREEEGENEKTVRMCVSNAESSSRLGLLSAVYREPDQRDYNYTETA